MTHDDTPQPPPLSPPSLPAVEAISVTPLPDLLGLGLEEQGSDPGGALRGRANTEELDTQEVARVRRIRLTSEEIDTRIWDGPPRSLQVEEDGLQVIAERYEVIERVGSGGMGRIFKVRHLNLGKVFALKLVDRQSDAARRIEQLFLREARVASVMDHPNIVQVIDFGQDDELGVFIVMEYLTGETLHERLRKLLDSGQRMYEAAVLEIGLQAAEALHYMHGQNVIHCDIKSENIFLCRLQKEHRQRTLVKLIDFGLSRRRASGLKLAKVEVAGTPEYMAPELLRGSAPQPGMDVYSLGVLFFEMLAGRLPFVGTIEQVIRSQLGDAPPRLTSLAPEGVDERLVAFVEKAMAKDPKLRHESMGQVIYELRTLMEMRNLRESRRGRVGHGRSPAVQPPSDLQRFFDQCPCPLFQLDAEGRLLAVNPAFRLFVGLAPDAPLGQRIDETRLTYVYASILEDLRTAVKRGQRAPIQRILAFQQEGGRRIPMMCWLTPDIDEQGAVVRFDGTIHPLQE